MRAERNVFLGRTFPEVEKDGQRAGESDQKIEWKEEAQIER